MMTVKLADIGVGLCFDHAGIERFFTKFETADITPELTYTLAVGTPELPAQSEQVDAPECVIDFFDGGYDCKLKEAEYVNALSVRQIDGKLAATVFVKAMDTCDEFCDEVFDIMKFAFYSALQRADKIALHSCSVVYRGKTVLFSANSGVGKSTHADFWRQAFGVEVFNGDVNVIGFEGNQAICYPIPWCGSSGLYMTHRVPLGAICFLERSQTNAAEPLDLFDSILRTARYCFTNNLTSEGMEHNLALSERICAQVPTCRLYVAFDISAAECAKEYIDSILSDEQ